MTGLRNMSAALLLALWVLQVYNVGRASSLLNGAVGESIILTTGVDGPIQAEMIQWVKDSNVIVQIIKKTMHVRTEAFGGRLTMNNETGALNISDLREEDSGKYVFTGVKLLIEPISLQLQVYVRIISVRVNSHLRNDTNSSSCTVTLNCSVSGGSQVSLSWSRAGQRIVSEENRTALSVSPSLTEEVYSCTASNPLSAQTGSVTVRPCQPHPHDKLVPRLPLVYIYSILGGGLLLILIAAIALICIMKKRKREKMEEDITVYAEVGENIQKDSVGSTPPHTGVVSTCYDVLKSTGNTTTHLTVYDMVNFDRAKATTQYQEVA